MRSWSGLRYNNNIDLKCEEILLRANYDSALW